MNQNVNSNPTLPANNTNNNANKDETEIAQREEQAKDSSNLLLQDATDEVIDHNDLNLHLQSKQ